MFLIKWAFWLAVIVMLVPIGSPTDDPSAAPEASPSRIELSSKAVGAARATVSDMAGFCDRNPEVCETGAIALERFKVKAILVAAHVFDLVSGTGEAARARKAEPRGEAVSAPRPEPVRPAELRPARDTLSARDRETPWHGPAGGDA